LVHKRGVRAVLQLASDAANKARAHAR
jgi:hypothetical protein